MKRPELTGKVITRRVRQHDGDSDLVGLEPWCVEVKLQKAQAVDTWWSQALMQTPLLQMPMLMWRRHGTSQWWVRSRLADVMQQMGIGYKLPYPVDMKLEDWVAAVGLLHE